MESVHGENLSRRGDELAEFRVSGNGQCGELPVARYRPETITELVDLVQRSRASGLHLLPVSSKALHYRGDTLTAPRTAILDLSAWQEVIRCDRRNRVLMFEAGVPFDRLTRSAVRAGMRPMLPLCPRPGKSALAAYLDREPTISPRFQWDLSDPLLCVEIVTGAGELFRTGGAAGPGSLVEQWLAGDAQKNPMGPGPADFVRIFQGAQGAYGVVTWCSAKAEPIPEAETLYVVGGEELEPLVEFTYALLRRSHPDIAFLVDGAALSALLHRDAAEITSARSHAAPWNLVFSLSTGRFQGDQKLAYVKREVEEKRVQLKLAGSLESWANGREGLHAQLISPRHPMNERWWKLAGRASVHEVAVQTTLDRAATLTAEARRLLAREAVGREAFIYIQPQLGGRCCHLEICLPSDHPASHIGLVEELTTTLCSLGGYASRPRGPGARAAVRGASTLPLIQKLQRVFDPDRVFAPNALRFLDENGAAASAPGALS